MLSSVYLWEEAKSVRLFVSQLYVLYLMGFTLTVWIFLCVVKVTDYVLVGRHISATAWTTLNKMYKFTFKMAGTEPKLVVLLHVEVLYLLYLNLNCDTFLKNTEIFTTQQQWSFVNTWTCEHKHGDNMVTLTDKSLQSPLNRFLHQPVTSKKLNYCTDYWKLVKKNLFLLCRKQCVFFYKWSKYIGPCRLMKYIQYSVYFHYVLGFNVPLNCFTVSLHCGLCKQTERPFWCRKH